MKLDNIAPTTPRLIFWVALSSAIAWIIHWLSNLPLFKSLNLEPWLMAIGPTIPFTLAVASWTLNNRERDVAAALKWFWEPFAEDCCIVLPTHEPIRGPQSTLDDPSPFTPYHDAVASSEVQAFLHRNFRCKTEVYSSKEVKDLKTLAHKNVIIVGGSNFNTIADQLMDELWTRFPGDLFHWAKTVKARPQSAHLISHPEDHLLHIDSEPTPRVLDSVYDVCAATPDGPKRLVEWLSELRTCCRMDIISC
jgi:hypothetical protein